MRIYLHKRTRRWILQCSKMNGTFLWHCKQNLLQPNPQHKLLTKTRFVFHYHFPLKTTSIHYLQAFRMQCASTCRGSNWNLWLQWNCYCPTNALFITLTFICLKSSSENDAAGKFRTYDCTTSMSKDPP